MNRYIHRFVVACPNNGARIRYELRVDTFARIFVEDIVKACAVDEAFHEDLADSLHTKFSGRQTLKAFHHGVQIETFRGAL